MAWHGITEAAGLNRNENRTILLHMALTKPAAVDYDGPELNRGPTAEQQEEEEDCRRRRLSDSGEN